MYKYTKLEETNQTKISSHRGPSHHLERDTLPQKKSKNYQKKHTYGTLMDTLTQKDLAKAA